MVVSTAREKQKGGKEEKEKGEKRGDADSSAGGFKNFAKTLPLRCRMMPDNTLIEKQKRKEKERGEGEKKGGRESAVCSGRSPHHVIHHQHLIICHRKKEEKGRGKGKGKGKGEGKKKGAE